MIDKIKKDKALWDLFSRREEYNPKQFDHHKRFLYKYSENKKVLEPRVSEFLMNNGFRIQWPSHKKFAVCLTHDIDHIYPSFKYRGFTAMKYGLKGKFQKSLNRMFCNENPYWNFRKIISLEKKFDAKSSFFFLADNSNYNIDTMQDELFYIMKTGNEIGLHGGYQTYNNFNLIKKEKEKIEDIIDQKIIGYRNHYLRFAIPQTWRLLEKAGFKYDTTLGYADQVGFRNGMCYPFKPSDLNTNEEIDIIEIPLIIMDNTLFLYMRLTIAETWQICKKIIDIVKNYEGVLTILWHNNSFDEIYRKGWGKLYEKILIYCHQENAWMTTGKNIWNLMDIDNI